ncbi:uncharacterized protein LOC117179405 [Belonocnema kinseyi]|uniref:uncharacterized protein LOC117179405 n=1 Tax=Belonocnema kinseyi TaxID=2817044 RepID=UPI00143D7405|nr:uncharacterized protein LOC117179405 [Belonocnema kinseyi]
MPNIRGPRASERKTLMSVAHSILLYGAEIWVDALNVPKYQNRMVLVQRRCAMRVASSYRTVSALAVMVVAGVIPIALLAKERKRIYNRCQSEDDRSQIKTERSSGFTMGHSKASAPDPRGPLSPEN